jgi:hypothetical protein
MRLLLPASFLLSVCGFLAVFVDNNNDFTVSIFMPNNTSDTEGYLVIYALDISTLLFIWQLLSY